MALMLMYSPLNLGSSSVVTAAVLGDLWGFVIGLILLAESQDSFRFTVMIACVRSALKYTLEYSDCDVEGEGLLLTRCI